MRVAFVTSIGMSLDTVRGKNGLEAQADRLASNLTESDVDGLLIPGGWAPDKLRRYPEITDLVRSVHDAGKPISIICHGASSPNAIKNGIRVAVQAVASGLNAHIAAEFAQRESAARS